MFLVEERMCEETGPGWPIILIVLLACNIQRSHGAEQESGPKWHAMRSYGILRDGQVGWKRGLALRRG